MLLKHHLLSDLGDLHCFYGKIERLLRLAIKYFLLLLLEHLSDAFQAHLRLYDRNIQRPKINFVYSSYILDKKMNVKAQRSTTG